jgi:hypothetical protein
VAKTRTASELFLDAVQKLVQTFGDPPSQQASHGPSLQAIEAVRKKQKEHEERKRRISQAIANGSRISRNI